MFQVTLEEVGKMRSGLEQLRHDLAQFLQASGYSPNRDSKAAKELAESSPSDFLHTVQCQGAFQNEIAADHLTAFLKTLAEPVETIAPWTCVRALLEMSALASWFLDSTIDMRERVARGFAHRFEGLTEQAKFSKSADLDSATARKRIDKVEADAIALGYARVLDRKGNRIGIARKMPSATQLIAEVHNQEETYRLLSAFAHGHPWAIQTVSFQLVPNKKVEPAGDGIQLHVIQKTVSLNATAFLALLAAEVFSRPFWHQCIYYGWDRNLLKDVLERNFDQIGVNDKKRFWRN